MADKERLIYLLELSYEDWKKKEAPLCYPLQYADGKYSVEEGSLSEEKFEKWLFLSYLTVKESAIKELRDHG